MDASKVRAIYDAHTRDLMWALCLNDWQIDVGTEKLGDGIRGECNAQYEYRRAKITLDPGEFKKDSDVLEVLFHELVHVALAAYRMPHNLAFKLTRTEDAESSIQESFRNADELAVKQIMYALEVGMDLSIKKIAALGAKARDGMKPAKKKKKKR